MPNLISMLPLIATAAKATVANEHLNGDELEWLRWVQIDASPSMLNDSMRLRALMNGATDVLDWYQGLQANRGDLYRMRGIPTSASEQYEYEESLQFKPAEVWSHFAQEGAAMNASLQPPTGGFGGKPTMTNIAPKWAEQVRQGLLRPALYGDAVTQDNVGAPLYGAPNGCCDVRSNAIFLAKHGAALGLPSNFSMGAHLLSLTGGTPPYSLPVEEGLALVQDRVVREIIRFHYVENLASWNVTYNAIKADAAEAGRPPVAVYGNVHIVENAYSVLVSQFLDVVWTETPAFLPHVGNPPTWGSAAGGFSALQYKLGRAAGNFSKPHWGIVTLTGCGLAPSGFQPSDGRPQILTATLAAAEAVANGAVAALLFGDTLGGDVCFPAALQWTKFVDGYRELFGPDRQKVADVAILYSLPTHMFIEDAQIGPSGFNWPGTNLPLSDVFSGLARVAEDHGLLYDVLLLDHPSVSTFNHVVTKLHQFRVVVLPVVLAMSDADASNLATWVRDGGILVAVDWNQTAMFTEDYVLRPPCPQIGGSRSAALQALVADPGDGKLRTLYQELIHYAFQGFYDEADNAAIAAAMSPTTDRPILEAAGLPPTVWRNVWMHSDGPMRSVALVNYDGNATTNELRPVTQDVNLSLQCCDASDSIADFGCGDINNASIVTFNGISSSMVLGLTNIALTDRCRLLHTRVPGHTIVGSIGVVVFSVLGEHKLRSTAALARKGLERLRIAARATNLATEERSRLESQIVKATVKCQIVQGGPLRAASLSNGTNEFASLAAELGSDLRNVTTTLTSRAQADRANTVAAAEWALLALAAVPPPDTKWLPLPTSQAFNGTSGYGWHAGGGVLVHSSEPIDGLHGNFIGIGHPMQSTMLSQFEESTLRVDIPNCNADAPSGVVTIISGSYDAGRQSSTTAVRVTGAVEDGVLQLPGDICFSGSYRHASFRYNCTSNRSLYISLHSNTSGDFYGDGYGAGLHTYPSLINGLLLTKGGSLSALTGRGSEYLKLAEGLARTQLRNWMVIGPFRDDNFTARDRKLGPEHGPVNYSATFDDGNGAILSWQPMDVPAAVGAPRAMQLPPSMSSQSLNKTVAVVFSTRLFVPATDNAPTLEVEISGSTSALAEISLNGDIVVQDRLVTGQLLREFSRRVHLMRGQWIELRVKAMQLSWASTWQMALSIHQTTSLHAVPGLRVEP